MKNIILIIVFLGCGLCGFGQTINLKVGSTTLPDSNEKIDATAARIHIQHKFKGDRMAASMIGGNGTIYKIKDVLVILNPQQTKVEEGHLLTMKKGLDNMFRKDPTYRSDIKYVNNNTFLMIDHIDNGVGYCSVYASNAGNTKLLSAFIEYSSADSVKARKVAQHVIDHFKFN